MIRRVRLVAHAATPAQRHLRFPAGDDDIEPLDDAATARVQVLGSDRSRAVRAPERRAARTAAALGLSAVVDDAVRCWSVGAWSGRPVAEVARDEPDAFRRWRTDAESAPHGGESLASLVRRVGAWLDGLDGDPQRLVVVTDAGVIRAAAIHALEVDLAAFWGFDVAPLSVTVLHGRMGEWRVRTLGG
jgi:broad specificity phosphatase PhoE